MIYLNPYDLAEYVRAIGKELMDNADEIVGKGDMIAEFNIWLRFPKDEAPSIEVNKVVQPKEVVKMLAISD